MSRSASATLFLLISSLRNLGRNLRRTLAIVVTVALGTGVLFLYHGFNAGIMNQYRENAVHALAGHGLVTTKGYRDQVFERPSDHWMTSAPKVAARLGAIAGVRGVFPRLGLNGLLTNGRVTATARGLGGDGPKEAAFFTTLNFEEGSAFTSEEDGIVLGKGLARALDAHPGTRVTLLTTTVDGTMNAADFVVTGVFHTGSKFVDDTLFRIPLAQAQSLLATEKIEGFAIGLDDTWGWPAVANEIAKASPELEATSFEQLDTLYYGNSVDFLARQYRVVQLIILAIVVLGILGTVTAAVYERRQEIGNLRANGDSRGDVLRLLSVEAVALGIVGGGCGVLLALLVTYGAIPHGVLMPPAPGLTRQFFVRVELQPFEALRAIVLGVAAALTGTVVAALRVTRLSIADALRSV